MVKFTLCLLISVASVAAAANLPDAPSVNKLTHRDIAFASASVAGAAFDAWTTQHNISRGCVEVNPILGSRPGAARLWLTESALTGVQLFAAWEFKRHGHARVAGMIVGGMVGEHVFAGVHNLQQTCP